jgi:hypothetical protein
LVFLPLTTALALTSFLASFLTFAGDSLISVFFATGFLAGFSIFFVFLGVATF